MNIHEEIEKLKITNELRDEIKVVKEEVTDLECDPYDAIDDQPDYQTLLKQIQFNTYKIDNTYIQTHKMILNTHLNTYKRHNTS